VKEKKRSAAAATPWVKRTIQLSRTADTAIPQRRTPRTPAPWVRWVSS